MALRGRLVSCPSRILRYRVPPKVSYSQYFGRKTSGANFWGPKGYDITWRRPLIITALTLPFFKSGKLSASPKPSLPSTTPIEISRIMLPDDTNTSGNVHGGTILKMIEQAGHVVANRHCNLDREEGDPPITTALVRLEKMDFHQPMLVGEVAQLQAAVTYTSPHSVEVTVDVWAENVITGVRRHTNTASLWYVGVLIDNEVVFLGAKNPCNQLHKLMTPIPQLKGLTQEEEDAGKKRYQIQKDSRKQANGSCPLTISSTTSSTTSPAHIYHYPEQVSQHTVLASQTTLANLVLPSDCTVTGHMMGGALMKMMDNAAGICGARHCRGRTVTACIDVVDFHQPIVNGEMVFVTARMIFTSAKSMEIEVTTEGEGLMAGSRRVTNTAYFTFVCLGDEGKAISVPPLKLEGKEEEERFEEGKKRYMVRKAARLSKTTTQ